MAAKAKKTEKEKITVRAKVSDFEGRYKAYAVDTGNGRAYKGPNYGRAVDIGRDVSYVLTTDEAQALYGDTHALRLRNDLHGRAWPEDIRLQEAPVRLVSLALTFNQLSRLMAQSAETGRDRVLQAFEKAAAKHGMTSLDQFFVIPSHVLPKGTNEDETVRNATMDEAARMIARKPQNIIVPVSGPASLLRTAHQMALLIEKQQAGFIGGNDFHLVGIYRGHPQTVQSLPVPVQDRAPISQITSELRRILG